MKHPTLLALAGGTLVACAAAPAQAEAIFAILNNAPGVGQTLVTIDSETRQATNPVVLQTASTLSPLASIDVRPATGQLYGYDAAARQVFTINPGNGALTAVGGPLPESAAGAFLIDFNPVVDAIRLTGNNDLNFRVNADTGAVIAQDGTQAYAAGDVNAGDNPNISGIGYSNSLSGATSTTLFGVDVDNDVLVTQTPANAGTLQTVGLLGQNLNSRGLFSSTFTSFDISGPTGTAYLTDGPFGGTTDFYTVDLATGIAINEGTIGGLGDRTVAGIAVAIPEPTAGLGLIAAGGLAALRRRRARA